MHKLFKFQFLLLLFVLSSCTVTDPIVSVDPSISFDCTALKIALTDEDTDTLEAILNPELANFTELDLDNDACPYTLRLDGFIELLNTNCDQMEASLFCCVCVETFPTQSEIIINYESNGVVIERILDIVSAIEEGDPLTFGGIH